MSASIVLVLILGALILGAAAVVIDRLNFPQRHFVAKKVQVDSDSSWTRDRTGAHIVDLTESDTENPDPPSTTG